MIISPSSDSFSRSLSFDRSRCRSLCPSFPSRPLQRSSSSSPAPPSPTTDDDDRDSRADDRDNHDMRLVDFEPIYLVEFPKQITFNWEIPLGTLSLAMAASSGAILSGGGEQT